MAGLVTRAVGRGRPMVALGSTQSFYDDKALVYRTFANQPLLDEVQRVLPTGGRVLDVGCASGGLLGHLPRAGFRAGLEMSPIAAAQARTVADQVVVGDIEGAEKSFPDGHFDVVVCADVLEHLADPAAALARVVAWTAPGGAVVISVPNIANWRSRLRLLRGIWRYEEFGLWDSGHLRFFTVETLRSLVAAAGLAEERLGTTQEALMGRLGLLNPAIRRGATRWPQLFGFQLISTSRK